MTREHAKVPIMQRVQHNSHLFFLFLRDFFFGGGGGGGAHLYGLKETMSLFVPLRKFSWRNLNYYRYLGLSDHNLVICQNLLKGCKMIYKVTNI